MASFERNASLRRGNSDTQGTASQVQRPRGGVTPGDALRLALLLVLLRGRLCNAAPRRVSTVHRPQCRCDPAPSVARLHGPLQRDLQLLQLIDRRVDVGLGSALLLRPRTHKRSAQLSSRVPSATPGPALVASRSGDDQRGPCCQRTLRALTASPLACTCACRAAVSQSRGPVSQCAQAETRSSRREHTNAWRHCDCTSSYTRRCETAHRRARKSGEKMSRDRACTHGTAQVTHHTFCKSVYCNCIQLLHSCRVAVEPGLRELFPAQVRGDEAARRCHIRRPLPRQERGGSELGHFG